MNKYLTYLYGCNNNSVSIMLTAFEKVKQVSSKTKFANKIYLKVLSNLANVNLVNLHKIVQLYQKGIKSIIFKCQVLYFAVSKYH